MALKNDDVGLFNATAQTAGNAVADVEGAHFFDVPLSNSGAGPTLQDGTSFFHASRGNLAGAASITTTSLKTAIGLLRKQRAPGGQRLNLRPAFLLCGPDAETAALEAVRRITPAGRTPTIEVLIDAALGSEWFLFASPAQRPAFVHAYLAMMPEPDVQHRTPFTTDGIEWRVLSAFAVGPYDPRAAVRNPGA